MNFIMYVFDKVKFPKFQSKHFTYYTSTYIFTVKSYRTNIKSILGLILSKRNSNNTTQNVINCILKQYL